MAYNFPSMGKKYADTLNLFDTAFPMRGDLARREPEMLAAWKKSGLYGQVRKLAKEQNRPRFVLHDGPPYANGGLHIGHAVNKILKDAIVRAKTLSGFDSPYLPGWDCHGLPIEHQVEKAGGRRDSPDDFRRRCRSFAESQIELQKAGFIRMGVMGEWEAPYKTMNPQTEAGIIRALGEIWKRELVTRRLKPVFWCGDCGSALAEAEVEYEEHESQAVDIAFPAADSESVARAFGAAPGAPVSAVIWTTTVWTLPGNRGIAAHPRLRYVLLEHQGRRFIVAESLRESAAARWNMAKAEVVGHASGADLCGLVFIHPLYERESPIFAAEYVEDDSGTGLVHTAPGHGPDDFASGVEHGWPLESTLDSDGRFLDSVKGFGGLDAWEAIPRIAAAFAEKGALLAQEPYRHSYPKCWRHKSPILFRADWQWFVEMDKKSGDSTLRAVALAAVEDTDFYPGWGKNRMRAMVEGRPDWCLSRQRNWNVPIPLFIHKETGEPHPKSAEIIERAAQIVEEGGIEEWFAADGGAILEEFGGSTTDYRRVSDTLDVWFDSGTTHYAVMDWSGKDDVSRPDMYLEGSDQHRGWFQSSLLTGCAIHGRAPYREILTHGFVIAADGRKMSKSLNNAISPDDVINKHGADVLRLWVGTSDYAGEIALSEEILKRVIETYRRLRNTTRFLLANLSDYAPLKHGRAPDELLELDRLMLHRAEAFRAAAEECYSRYAFHEAMQLLQRFCSLELGSFYLDILKDRLYVCPQHSDARRSAQNTLWHIAQIIIKAMAPVLCFTADEAWRALMKDDSESPLLHTWTSPPPMPKDGVALAEKWKGIEKWRALALKEIEERRAGGIVRSSLEASLTLRGAPEDTAALQTLGDELRHVFIVSAAHVESEEGAPMSARAEKSPHGKCARCWHHEADVNGEELCGRCARALKNECDRRFV